MLYGHVAATGTVLAAASASDALVMPVTPSAQNMVLAAAPNAPLLQQQQQQQQFVAMPVAAARGHIAMQHASDGHAGALQAPGSSAAAGGVLTVQPGGPLLWVVQG
uniref:Uncharacterized protein n=1 Tax=Tetradesmus obliquus TaxID=3088 RepID=A0A383WAE5_TETOB|eukprot:jgi/Sobl393_1/18507/SZX73964.1